MESTALAGGESHTYDPMKKGYIWRNGSLDILTDRLFQADLQCPLVYMFLCHSFLSLQFLFIWGWWLFCTLFFTVLLLPHCQVCLYLDYKELILYYGTNIQFLLDLLVANLWSVNSWNNFSLSCVLVAFRNIGKSAILMLHICTISIHLYALNSE